MAKTILIPTDFSIESLHLFKSAVQLEKEHSLNVIFMYCKFPSDSIIDRLFSSPEKQIDPKRKSYFLDGCTVIRNKFASRILSDRIEVFSGNTQAAFQNFLEGNRVMEVIAPQENIFRKSTSCDFDPMPFIDKCKMPVKRIALNPAKAVHEENQLAELFNSSHVALVNS